MTAADFAAWRARLRLTQTQAGAELNRTKQAIINYEKGRDPVPREIELACMALEIGPLSLLRRKSTAAD